METKEIDGVLYKLVPEEKEKSCHGCIFKDPDGDFCRIITGVCNKGLIYKKADKPISDSHLKPFNLEEAKAGKPVCTRDGRKARIVCFNRNAAKYHIIALIECKGFPNKEEEIEVYTNDGKYLTDEENSYDLMMLPEKKEGWIIKPKDYQVYQNKEDAERVCNKDYQVIAKISWEE